MKRILLAGAAVAALTAPSFAADIPAELPVPEAPVEAIAERDWGGFYLGIQGGYAFGDISSDEFGGSIFDDDDDDDDFDLDDFDAEHFVAGIYSGYNRQYGNFVFGIDNSVSYTDLDEDIFDDDIFDDDDDDDDDFGVSVDMQYLVTTRGRIGYAFDNFLLFAAGGLALANVEVEFEFDGDSDEDEHLATGWTAGAGVEAMLSDHWTARVEYLYVDVDEEYAVAPDDGPGFEADVSIQEHIVRGGVAYKF